MQEKGKEVFMGGLPQIVLFAGILSLGGMLANLGRSDVQEISFQHFKTHLLAQGLVEKVEVANKASAKVYVRAGSARYRGASHPRTTFTFILSIIHQDKS